VTGLLFELEIVFVSELFVVTVLLFDVETALVFWLVLFGVVGGILSMERGAG
jgi:hypothetical protein